jgi:cell wall-associated NlpC family hydrolase
MRKKGCYLLSMIKRFRIPLVIFPLALVASCAFASPSSPSSSPQGSTGEATHSAGHLSYISVKGESFTSISDKFDCTVRELKKLNGLKVAHLKPGTTLLIPGSHAFAEKRLAKKNDKTLLADTTAKKLRHHSPLAQPVQDFDVAPSNYASCPPPPSNAEDGEFTVPAGEEVPPPIVGAPGDQMPQPLAENHRASLLPVPTLAPAPTRPKSAPMPSTLAPGVAAVQPANPLLPPTPARKTFANALADFFGGGSRGLSASESGAWGNRFLVEARNLAAQGICYDGSWRPDGESRRWEMDCSNTTRYLYQVTAGIALPRTASDQYYYLHLQDKAWDVPMTASGFADTSYLRGNLKPGDLLFWENTYRPERQPPITHVMIYLGTDAQGRWIMAGSQGSKGFYNRRHSGPDVYVFNPTRAVGGYTTWLGLVHHHGRFVAYGRPLEADVKKLSVATDD